MTVRTHSWDAPDCPECDSEVFVDAQPGQPQGYKYVCRLCGVRFTPSE